MHNVKVESPLMLHGIKDRQTMLKTSKFFSKGMRSLWNHFKLVIKLVYYFKDGLEIRVLLSRRS